MPNKQPSPSLSEPRKRFTSLRKTLFWEASVLLTFAVVVTAVIAFFLAKSEVDSRTFAQLQSIVHAKEDLLEGIVSRQREQVAILARESAATTQAASYLIGFKDLFILENGRVRVLTGEAPLADELRQLEERTATGHTAFVPIMSPAGWESYMITAPRVDAAGNTHGQVVAVFNARPLIKELMSADYLGKSADVSLGVRKGDDLLLLHTMRDQRDEAATPLYLGGVEQEAARQLALAKAVLGREGSDKSLDYAGVTVLTAYRSLPSIGWGIVVQVDQFEVYAPLLDLGARISILGVVLVGLLSSIMFSLSRRIADPLYELSEKLQGLETKEWRFERSIFTRNELEEVDQAAFDLTKRLRESHTHLEDIVKKRTQALVEQHAEDDAIFESIEYGLLVTNVKGEIVQMNRAAARLTGWTEHEAKGMSFAKVLPIQDKDGKDMPEADHPLSTVLNTRQQYSPNTDEHLSMVRKDKTPMPLSLRATPILHGSDCSGAVAVFADVTETRRIDRLKSEFISLVSHQLRTPLSSIRWYLEMLSGKDTGPLTDEQENCLREASTSTERMVHLVNALLNVSRIELGKFALKLEMTDLLPFVRESVKSLALDLEHKKINVEFKVKNQHAFVRTDGVLLRLVLENLVSNAMKYSQQGSTITIVVASTDTGATIDVIDQGIGIPATEQSKIFGKLFRGSNAVTVDTDGNGLGLYISNIAIQTIGGSLAFVSKERQGTTFTVTLPKDPMPEEKKD